MTGLTFDSEAAAAVELAKGSLTRGRELTTGILLAALCHKTDLRQRHPDLAPLPQDLMVSDKDVGVAPNGVDNAGEIPEVAGRSPGLWTTRTLGLFKHAGEVGYMTWGESRLPIIEGHESGNLTAPATAAIREAIVSLSCDLFSTR